MVKYLLAIVIGIVVAGIIIMSGELALSKIYQLPEGINVEDKQQMSIAISRMPSYLFMLLLLTHAVASFIGGIVATLLSNRTEQLPAIIVGIILTIAGIINVLQFEHPIWFIIANIFAYLPLSWLAFKALRRKNDPSISI